MLLVVDSGSGDEELRRHLGAVAIALYGEFISNANSTLIPAVYRLGECRPFWAPTLDHGALARAQGTQERPPLERLLPRGIHFSALIGPLFKAIEELRDQVSMVLVIGGVAPIDLDDWAESAWWAKVRLYGDGAPPEVASFATLPEPIGLVNVAAAAGSVTVEAEQVATYLAKLDESGGIRKERAVC